MNWIKKLFAQATPLELAVAELVDAQREKLQAESGAEYAEALVIYNQSRIEKDSPNASWRIMGLNSRRSQWTGVPVRYATTSTKPGQTRIAMTARLWSTRDSPAPCRARPAGASRRTGSGSAAAALSR